MRRRIVEGAGQTANLVARERSLALFDTPQRRAHHHGETLRGHGKRSRARLTQEVVRGGDEQSAGPAIGHARPLDRTGELLDLTAVAHAEIVHREALDARDAVGTGEQGRPEGVDILGDRRAHAAGENRDALQS